MDFDLYLASFLHNLVDFGELPREIPKSHFFVLQRGFDITQKEAVEGDIPVISSSGISYYHNEAKLQPPGVITGRKGSLGDVYYIEIPFWPHDTTLWVKDFKGNLPVYVALFLDYMNLEQFDAATSIPTLNRNVVHDIKIHFPPLPEQRKIAEILSTWDEAIQLVEALIAALTERKKGLMQHLLTGEVRFPGFDGEWEETELGNLFTERNEKGFDDLPLVAITMEDGIIWRDELDRKDTSSADKSKYLRICPGDIGYNTMRMWQGVSGVSDIEGIVSSAYTICTPRDHVDVEFMGYLFQLTETIHKFWRYSQGLVKDTLTLRYSNFEEIKVKIPNTIVEQSKIADAIRSVYIAIEELSVYNDSLHEQKKGLMQRLLTGAVRVKVEE